MANCVIISPLNLLYEPEVYNYHFFQISDLQKITASCQGSHCFCCTKSEVSLNCWNGEITFLGIWFATIEI